MRNDAIQYRLPRVRCGLSKERKASVLQCSITKAIRVYADSSRRVRVAANCVRGAVAMVEGPTGYQPALVDRDHRAGGGAFGVGYPDRLAG